MDRWTRTEPPPASIEPRTCEHCEAPLRGWWVDMLDRRQGARREWVWGTCVCRDMDYVRERFDGARDRPDNSLQDALGEAHDLEDRH